MNISRAADLAGVTPKTVRYYESIGLMPQAARRENGYRDYSDQDVAMLTFISRARGLGFPIRRIKSLVALWRDRQRASGDVKALAQEHIADIDRHISELMNMRDVLVDLSKRCNGDERPECPILDGLEKGDLLHAVRGP